MATKSGDELQKDVMRLREWIDRQPHLPKDIEENLLKRFVHSCYYDMEKAKNTVDLFFTIRASAPEMLNNRDPQSPPIQKAIKITNLAQYKSPREKNIWIWQLNDPGLENYDYCTDAKLFFLATDAWLLDNEYLEKEDIIIMDVKDITLKFITKFNLSLARKLSKYQEDAIPIRLKEVHVMNSPPFIDKIYSLVKPMLKQEITNVIHFHSPNSETIYKHLNKDELPQNYGGTLPALEEFNEKVVEMIMSHRERFLNDNMWKADLKKHKNKEAVTTEVGSFRSIEFD